MKIHTYAARGDCTGLQAELAGGVSVDVRDENDYTPLAHAASSRDAGEEVLRLLIDAGADVNAAVDNQKRSPIGLAACSGSFPKVQLLLDAGADIQFKDPNGYTALTHVMYALYNDERLVPMVRFLIEAGANIDSVTTYGESAVSVAARFGRFDAVEFLLGAGADPSGLRWTEMLRTAALGSVDDLRRLLSSGCRVDDRDRWNRTPWFLAAIAGDIDKARLLLSAGANTEDRALGGETALIACACTSNVAMLQWLIEAGADIESVDELGNSALMRAAQAGEADCVQLLLKAGADPFHQNQFGETAISLAVSEPIVRMLVEAGQDLNDISTEMKRQLTGLRNGEQLDVTRAQYQASSRRRFGRSNPEVMAIPFWHEMVRSGITAYQAKVQFEDEAEFECTWCFSRFGMSFTALPDGRYVQIGGEHEDFYDPDFCIYNEVVVHEPSGKFQIFGYPETVFPPTDFHSATYVEGNIYIIGRLGYHGTREFGTTPVYKLDCKSWKMEAVRYTGENPGWIYEHKASYDGRGSITVKGGKIAELCAGKEQHVENQHSFSLSLSTLKWTRIG